MASTVFAFGASPNPSSWPSHLRSAVDRAATPLIFPAILVALWWLSAERGWLPISILPGPGAVVQSFRDMWAFGDITNNLGVSLRRVAIGFGLGGLLGVLLGMAMGFSRTADAWLGPTFRTVAQIPSLTWIPLLMVFLGIDELLKTVVMAKACLVPVTISTAAGIRNIPKEYREVADILQLRRSTIVFRLILPGALPSIFTGLRQGLSAVWTSLVIVEMMASPNGIGYLMSWGRQLFQLDVVIVSIIIVGVIGFGLDFTLKKAERKLLARWS
jgi:sulfonate transport system permease protein